MIKSRTQSERSVVVVDVVLVVVVAVADGDHSGRGQDHGHVYDHDPLRLSWDYGATASAFQTGMGDVRSIEDHERGSLDPGWGVDVRPRRSSRVC